MTGKRPKAKKKPKPLRAFDKLKAKMRKKSPIRVAKLLDPENSGGNNLADTFFLFILPFMASAETDVALNKLFTIGILAWNVGCVTDDELKTTFANNFGSEEGSWSTAEKNIFGSLLERKAKEFPEFRETLLNYELNSKPTGREFLLKYSQ